MRIQVIGDCPSAENLRRLLGAQGFQISRFHPQYMIHIEEGDWALAGGESPGEPVIIVDGVDSELERRMCAGIEDFTATPMVLKRRDGVRSEWEIRFVLPRNERIQADCERGIVRGLLFKVHLGPKLKWHQRLTRRKK